MGTVYSNPAQKINLQTYEVRIPEGYDPVVPDYYVKFNVVPIRTPVAEDMCFSMMSPKYIIDMIFNNVPFVIVKETDLREIIAVIREYVNQVERYVGSSSEIAALISSNNTDATRAFVEKCKQALSVLEHETDRINRAIDYKEEQNMARPLSLIEILQRLNRR